MNDLQEWNHHEIDFQFPHSYLRESDREIDKDFYNQKNSIIHSISGVNESRTSEPCPKRSLSKEGITTSKSHQVTILSDASEGRTRHSYQRGCLSYFPCLFVMKRDATNHTFGFELN